MSHQMDPKTSGIAVVVASRSDVDDEWVYLDGGVAAGKAAAAFSKGKEVMAEEEEEDGASSGEEGYSDDEEEYSDYSNEGRLEKAYESDEDVDVQVNEYDGAVVDDVGNAKEEGESDEEACSDDDFSDYSGEGRLEKAYESDEDVDQVYSYQADAAEEEDGASGEESCSDDDFSDYSGEGRLEKAYESDEDLDQVDESESDHGTFYLKELEKQIAGAAAPTADVVADPAACATDVLSDGIPAATNFFDYYYDQSCNDYFGYGRSSGYGAPSSGYGAHGGVGGYLGGGYYGYGAGRGGYYGAGYGYGGAGLPPRPADHPYYYMPGVGMYPLLPVPYELPHPYTAAPAPAPVPAPQPPIGQCGIVYIPNPALSPMAPTPPQPQPQPQPLP